MSTFESHVAGLPALLRQLRECDPFRFGHLPRKLPPQGVYLFSDHHKKDEHYYVGRTRRLRARLADHYRVSSGVNKAALAVLVMRSELDLKATYRPLQGRARLLDSEETQAAFRRAKDFVRQLDIRVVGIDDPIDQALFEVYAALTLPTSYNGFHTH